MVCSKSFRLIFYLISLSEKECPHPRLHHSIQPKNKTSRPSAPRRIPQYSRKVSRPWRFCPTWFHEGTSLYSVYLISRLQLGRRSDATKVNLFKAKTKWNVVTDRIPLDRVASTPEKMCQRRMTKFLQRIYSWQWESQTFPFLDSPRPKQDWAMVYDEVTKSAKLIFWNDYVKLHEPAFVKVILLIINFKSVIHIYCNVYLKLQKQAFLKEI